MLLDIVTYQFLVAESILPKHFLAFSNYFSFDLKHVIYMIVESLVRYLALCVHKASSFYTSYCVSLVS